MEAVVKSLDPGSNSDREAVLDTATEVIALVVQTYASFFPLNAIHVYVVQLSHFGLSRR